MGKQNNAAATAGKQNILRPVPELLSPAGSKEAFIAAVESGADAVYCGGALFNARMNASNFDDEEMSEAIAFAHRRGVKVYVTVNTLLRDDELKGALIYAGKLSSFGADALIIQDVGFGSLVKENIPELPIHFSTQGSVYGPEGVKLAASLGYSRIVLARELSLEEIRKACAVGPEIEIFCHGALCICYSGQCQMSRSIGGRSGNRGMCAQPCRLAYETVSGPEYLLSPADLCLIERIGDFAEAGVASLKIEGRMKSPEYVSVVTSTYRKYLDRYERTGRSGPVDESDRLALAQIFSRGFTEAYMSGKSDKFFMSGDVPKNKGVLVGTVTNANAGRSLVEIKQAADSAHRPERRSASNTMPETELVMGDVVEIRGRDGKTQGRDGKTQGRDGKTQGWDAKGQDRDTKPQGRDAGTGSCTFKVTYREALPGGRLKIGDVKDTPSRGDEVYRIVSSEQMKAASASYRNKDWHSGAFTRKIPVKAMFEAGSDGRISLLLTAFGGAYSASAFAGPFAHAEPESDEAARNRAVRSLEKTGGTPYTIEEISFAGPFALSVPMSAFNELRRSAVSALDEALAGRRQSRPLDEVMERQWEEGGLTDNFIDPAVELYFLDTKALFTAVAPEGAAKSGSAVSSVVSKIVPEQIAERLKNAGVELRAVVPAACAPDLEESLYEFSSHDGCGFALYTSQISQGREDALLEAGFEKIKGIAAKGHGIYVGNAEWFARMTTCGVETCAACADFGLNIFNTASENVFRSLGASGTVRSLEELSNADGPFPLMVSRHAFDTDSFVDRKGVRYRVLSRDWSDVSVIIRDEKPDFKRLAEIAEQTGKPQRAYIFVD